jgi:hypothetical protein
MAEKNLFLKDDDTYTRQLNPIKDYIEQAALYCQKKHGVSYETALEKISSIIKTNLTGRIRNPIVKYLERGDNGDRKSLQTPLSQYLKEIVDEKNVLAPTMTSYLNPEVKLSILGDFTEGNVKKRSPLKKEALAAQAAGDIERYIAKNNEQGTIKIYNNSLSGAFGSSGTSLTNLSGHSTLTSTTRAVSSLGNAINEKLISGNRHYRNFHIVLNNITAICKMADLQEIDQVMQAYGLVYPTAQQALECVEYSTRLYWNNQFYLLKIYDYLEKLTPVERAAFVYIGDLYHLRLFNPSFVRKFLTDLKTREVNTQLSQEEALQKVKQTDEMILNFACQICSEDVKGLGKTYASMPLPTLQALAGTSSFIEKTLNQYKPFIQAFFVSKIIPASVAYMPAMVRRAVILSDTDSTIFSTDDYVQWYYGQMIFSPEAFALAASVMFLTTQSIANGLRILSANIGIEKRNLGILSMKPEFSFEVFIQTPVAKHYFASISVQEGNVFSKPKFEIKGVHLKSSAAPVNITEMSKKWMETILLDVADNKKISLRYWLDKLRGIEQDIIDSINKGEIIYFRSAKIKQLEAYAGKLEITPYFHQVLWDKVFLPKYGYVEPVPNVAIKIPLDLPNKTACQTWIASIEDKAFSQRLSETLALYNKDNLGTILINRSFCLSQGVPKEIIPVIDKKRIVLELTKSFRMIIESLGFCIKKDFLITEF